MSESSVVELHGRRVFEHISDFAELLIPVIRRNPIIAHFRISSIYHTSIVTSNERARHRNEESKRCEGNRFLLEDICQAKIKYKTLENIKNRSPMIGKCCRLSAIVK